MKILRLPVLLLGLALAPGGCATGGEAPVTVYAAASLTDALEEAGRAFEEATGIAVRVRTGSSGSLALALTQGAPADVFLSASATWMDELDRRRRIEPGSRRVIARNRLVVVVPAEGRKTPAEAIREPGDLVRARRIALGETSTVPAGIYAREALVSLGIWEGTAGRRIEAPDVRAVLALVERGEVDAGIVYATDARASARVRVACAIPADTHAEILVPGAVPVAAPHPELGLRFLEFLADGAGRGILAAHGFLPESGP